MKQSGHTPTGHFASFDAATRPVSILRDPTLEAFGRSAQRPVVLDHAAGQAQPAGLGQRCITRWGMRAFLTPVQISQSTPSQKALAHFEIDQP